MFYAFSYTVKATKTFAGLGFTFQIFAFCAFTMYFPYMFTDWGFNTKVLIVPSVQLIMFGMGTKLSLADFAREFKKPAKILIGTALGYILIAAGGPADHQGVSLPGGGGRGRHPHRRVPPRARPRT